MIGSLVACRPSGMDGRCNERHPGESLGLLLDVILRQQARLGIAPRQVEKDRSDFGQGTSVDEQRRHLAFGFSAKYSGARFSFFASERGRLSNSAPIS
jgi:hypothetical protein